MRILFAFVFTFFSLSTTWAESKTEYGYGTVISDEYQGSQTASGEIYDKTKHTASHKTLPFGSIIKVTNMDNNKSVMVKVIDRGPFIKGYVVELSGAASQVIAIKDKKANVKIEVEKEGDYIEDSEIKESPDPSLAVVDASTPEPENEPKVIPDNYEETGDRITEEDPKKEDEGIKAKENVAENNKSDENKDDELAANELTPIKDKGYKIFDLYKASTFTPKEMGYGVQVGTYSQLHNVLKETAKLQENWFSKIMLTRAKQGDKTVYKIIIGPFEERASASSYAKSAAKKGVKGFVTAVQPAKDLEVYQIKAVRPSKEGYAVQVMNLNDSDNVILEVDKLQKKWFKNILIHVTKGANDQPNYKLLLGPFPDKGIANSYKNSLKAKKVDGFVVDLGKIK